MKKPGLKFDKTLLILAGIFLLALALRAAYLYQLKDTAVFGFYTTDSQYHDQFALKILHGNLLFKDAVYFNPLYSFILAAIYSLAGHNLIAVGLCQAVIDSLTAVLLYFICVKIFKKSSIGLLAAFIYAFFNTAIFYSGFLVETSFCTFFTILFAFVLLYALDKKTMPLWFLSGLMLGLSVLLRANGILIIPFLCIWLYVHNNKRIKETAMYLVIFLLGVSAALLPFSMRNYMIDRSFSPLPVNGGVNFYIGNNPQAKGVYSLLRDFPNSPISQVKISALKGDQAYWLAKGLDFIKDHPVQYLKLAAKKIFIFWNGTEVAANESFYFCRDRIPILKFPFFSFGLIAPFALLGFVFAAKKNNAGLNLAALLVAAYMVSVILFFVTSRFRFPCVPLVIIAASYAASEMFFSIRSGGSMKLSITLPALALFFLLVNYDIPGVGKTDNVHVDYNNVGVNYYRMGETFKAILEFKKSIIADPLYPEAYNNLAAAYHKSGEDDKAIRCYKKVIELNPYFSEAYYGLANIYSDTADRDEAISLYKKAVELDPGNAFAYNNLGYLYSIAGRWDEAVSALEKAIEIDPGYAKAYNNLGITYAGMGQPDRASILFKKALEIDPGFSDARVNLAIASRHKSDE